MVSRGLRFLTAAAMAVVLGVLAAGPASAAAPQFDPSAVMCFEALESGARCDGDTTPGAATDLRLTFCTSWNDDCVVRDSVPEKASPGGMVAFTPPGWNVPKGDTIPIGAIAGRVVEERHLGLLGGSCNNRIQASGTLLNASINVSETVAPRPEGETDRMQPLAMDANGNGIPDGADRYPTFLAEHFQIDGSVLQPRARLFGATNIQGNWVIENILFFEMGTTLEIAQTRVTLNAALGYPAVAILGDPTSDAAPSSITELCGPTLFDLVILGKTLDNPCTPISVAGANCPVTADVPPEFVSSSGEPYPSMPCDPRSTVDDDGDGMINDGCPQVVNVPETGSECNNDTSDDLEDSTVNDGCPQAGDVSEGSRIPGNCTASDEGGCTQRSNPVSSGSQTFTVGALSERDADGDGITNDMDVCFDKPNPEWNPWGPDPVNDTDSDGLPNVCDPEPDVVSPGPPAGCASGYTGPDWDQDCFTNRQDNCPTTRQLEDPAQPPGPANRPLQTDTDGDRIGDACDPDPNVVNGDYVGFCLKFGLVVGQPPAPVVGVTDPSALWPDCAAAVCNIVPCVGGGNGDADCDGGVDAVDALYVLRWVARLPVAAGCVAEGDVDCSLGMTAADAVAILRYVARLESGLPLPCLAMSARVDPGSS